jgi:DNA-binding CsgD family transcriptional regulator
MSQQDLLQDFIEQCLHRESIAALDLAFRRAVTQLGFRFFALCSHVDPLAPPPHSILIHNYPAAWMQAHSERGLRDIDPVLLRAERDPLPFHWDDAFRAESLTVNQRRLLEEAASHGLQHGYTIPLHLSWMPGVERASCSVVPGAGPVHRDAYWAVELMATYLYAVAMPAARIASYPKTLQLTARERQCLELAAEGKDNWAIGRLLGLSEGTVHTYVERAKRRLGVATRIQAVVRALAMGQISFGDITRAQGVAGRP